ncbi:MAG TPA: hypothetical protein VK168_01990 [Saprospiraceae bacterium]|nr:hypothetical protein [Saprospiraceae bacterium]
MTTRLYFILSLGLLCIQAGRAQKAPKQWTSGLFGSLSAHYGAFQQPLRNVVSPYSVAPGSGLGFQAEGGIAFKNHLGMKLLLGAVSTSNMEAGIEKELEAQNPGYYADFVPFSDFQERRSTQLAFGFTYAFPFKNGWFEPEIMFGGTQVFADQAHTRLKKAGSHDIMVMQYRPVNTPPLSPTLFLGARVNRYLTPWFGIFANVRGMAIWYQMDYWASQEITFLPQPEDIFTVKKSALGVQAGAGIFVQMGKW